MGQDQSYEKIETLLKFKKKWFLLKVFLSESGDVLITSPNRPTNIFPKFETGTWYKYIYGGL